MRMSPDSRARWICAAVGLTLVTGLLHSPAAAIPPAAIPPAAIPPASASVAVTPFERPDEVAAVVSARTTGKPVLITSRTTETTEYRALPSGRIEATIAGGPVRMRNEDG